MPERELETGEEADEERSPKVRNRRVHMANERTFLAWIRASIGIMAFGFVVERFALFVKQMEYILGRTIFGKAAAETASPGHGYSAVLGIVLVAPGA